MTKGVFSDPFHTSGKLSRSQQRLSNESFTIQLHDDKYEISYLSLSFLYFSLSLPGAMKESDFDWDDLGSHDGLGDPLQPDLRRMAVAVGFDEAEAANMLVSLGTSRSGTPVFSPGT